MELIDNQLADAEQELKKVDREIEKLQGKRRDLLRLKEKLAESKSKFKIKEIEAKNDWSHESFPWSTAVRQKLQDVFQIREFRLKQLETINTTLSKYDVILISPTGGGKSLCYQLPAVCSNGLTLVVSPLIALMEDQVYSLKKKGIKAELLSANTDKEIVSSVHKTLSDNCYSCPLKLLYVTPERLAKSKRLMSCLQKCHQFKKLERIAIDEIHCCSSWGHDFRNDYKYLSNMKKLFPEVPIIGTTATATTKVIDDVKKMLNIRDCLTLTAPFNRPNLYYHVLEKPSEKHEVYNLLANLLKKRYAGETGIIYTFSIKDTQDITNELLQREVRVRPYHASLDHEQRTSVYKKWMSGEIQAVVATIAFGMGIDKPNVRFVIHHTLSKSMENFYQESGRAGRDGKAAECVILYKFSDMFKISTMTFSEHNGLQNAYSMINYCIEGRKCRRVLISKYFSEVWDDDICQKKCDHCMYKNSVLAPKLDIYIYYKTLCKIIDKAENVDIKLTGLKLVDAWLHKGPAKLRLDASPPLIDRYYAEQIVAHLITSDYLVEDFHYTAYSTNSYIKRGNNFPDPDSKMELLCARVYKLPTTKEFLDETDADNKKHRSDEEVPIKRNQNDSSDTKEISLVSLQKEANKRRISVLSTDEENERKPVKVLKRIETRASTSGLNRSRLQEIIEEQVKMEVKKLLNVETPDETVKVERVSDVKADVEFAEVTSTEQDDDVIILTPNKEMVINIDDDD